ncbi:hypothetical protein PMAYCL1PPCAC_30687, partial [Pristionchus mayeri]
SRMLNFRISFLVLLLTGMVKDIDSASSLTPSSLSCKDQKEDGLPIFLLRGGSDNEGADLRTLRLQQEKMKDALRNSTVATAWAITNFIAAVSSTTDHDLKIRVCSDIHTFLSSSPCPDWELDFNGPAEYQLCNCFYNTSKEWTEAKEEIVDLHPQNQSKALFSMAVRTIHRCNAPFVWSLLALLFIEHGILAGMVVFREKNFDLFYDALDYTKDPAYKNSTKAAKYSTIMDSIEFHLTEEVAEFQYHKLDLILRAINSMKSFNFDDWMERLEHSMLSEWELKEAMKSSSSFPSLFLVFFILFILAALIIVTIPFARKYHPYLFSYRRFTDVPLVSFADLSERVENEFEMHG